MKERNDDDDIFVSTLQGGEGKDFGGAFAHDVRGEMM